MIILSRQKKFINIYNIINITRIQMLNLSLHIGHKKVQWSKYLSLFVVGFRAGLVLLNLDYALLYLRRAFSFVNKVLYFYGRLFSISNFVNVGFGGLSQYFLNKRRKGLVGHYDGYYMGGLVSNFFKIRKAKKRFKFEFVRKFARFKYRLPSVFFIFDANEHFLCYKESSFVGIPSVGFLDSDLDYQHALYPIIANDESIVANIYVLLVVSYFVKINRFKRRLKFFRLFLKFFIILLKYWLFHHIITIGSYVKFKELILKQRAFDMYGYLYNWGKRPSYVYVYKKIPDTDIQRLQDSIFMYQSQLYDNNIAPGVWRKTYKKIYSFLFWFLSGKKFRYKRYRRWLMYFYKNYTPTITQVSNFGVKFAQYSKKIINKYENQKNQAWGWNNDYRTAVHPKTLYVQDMFVKRLFRPVFYYKYGFFLRLISFRYSFDLLAHRVFRIFNEKRESKQVYKYFGMKREQYLFFDEMKTSNINFSKKTLKNRNAFDKAWKEFLDVRIRSQYLIFTIIFYFYRAEVFNSDLFFFFRHYQKNKHGFWFNKIKNLKKKSPKALYGRYHYSRRRFWRYISMYLFYFKILLFWFVSSRKFQVGVYKKQTQRKIKGFFIYNNSTGKTIEYDTKYKKKNKFSEKKYTNKKGNKLNYKVNYSRNKKKGRSSYKNRNS